MILSRIKLRNFGPYRGEHSIELSPTIYGVVASREDDPEASNWTGKTWFLSAIRFALFGTHLADREDGWISRGEREGLVSLFFDDGSWSIERSRRIGESTRLVSTFGSTSAHQKDAQQEIERRIGLDEKDFLAAGFFPQKQMSRFVTARPSERSEDVSAWLRLDALRSCAKKASAVVSKLADEETRLAGKVEALRERIGDLLDVGDPEKVRDHATETLKIASGVVRHCEEEFERATKLRSLETTFDQIRRLRNEIAKLEAEPDEDLTGLESVLEDLATRTEEHVSAVRELQAKRKLASGDFDGRCPVGGVPCPISSQLNADRERNAGLLTEAARVERYMYDRKQSKMVEADILQKRAEASRTRRTTLDALRAQLKRFEASAPILEPGIAISDIPDENEISRLKVDLRVARSTYEQALIAKEAADRRASEIEQSTTEIEKIDAERSRIAGELQTAREAVAVLGRNGAQRRIAEGALLEIEAGANALLSEAGIDLSVATRWDRETDRLASSCETCGSSFPDGRRVKVCSRCGSPRGPKLSEALDVELSSRSGAAEDLAGIALSLSASAWLRRERDVQWSVLCADEPFSAADSKNRRALLSLFRSAMTRCSLRQMFLVAHNDGIMDGLPGRIRIVGGPNGSRISVE